MENLYLQKKTYIKRINDLYKLIDRNDNNSISVNEFFEIIDILEKNPRF